ncbi:Uncharacterised protein [Vibrio cholerae]|nr:Uncharacterised protein [Vibrio cholerae]
MRSSVNRVWEVGCFILHVVNSTVHFFSQLVAPRFQNLCKMCDLPR